MMMKALHHLYKKLGTDLELDKKIPTSSLFKAVSLFSEQYLLGQVDAISQRKLVKRLLKRDKFNLVIFDTARHDYFKELYGNYLDGKLHKVITSAGATAGSIGSLFPNKYDDITYFSSMPMINSVGHPHRDHRLVGWYPWNHIENIVDVWEFGWDDELNCVPPSAMNDAVRKIDGDKKVIHYCQPHGSWIGETKVFTTTTDKTISERVNDGSLSEEKLIRAYKDNLKLVLERFAELKDYLKGKTVVTADHGEFLGEMNRYGEHVYFIPHPALRVVPWLGVE